MIDNPSKYLAQTVRGTHDERIRATWRILSALILALGGGLGGLVLIQRVGVEVPDWAVLATVQLFAVMGVIIALVIVARYLDQRNLSDYGFDVSPKFGLDAFAGTIAGIGLVGIAFALNYQQGTVTIVEVMSSGTADSLGLAVVVVLVGWVLLGFWEETLFRGLVLKNAAEGLNARRLSPRTAVIVAWIGSSLLFGILHGPFGSNPGPVSIVYSLAMTVLTGGLFGWAYLLSGELAFPMGLHVGINLADANMFFGSPNAAVPTLLRVEQSVSGGPVQFSSTNPRIIIPVFIIGFLLITGYFYLRHGFKSIRRDIAIYETNR